MIHPYPFFGSYGFRKPYHYYSYPKTSYNNTKKVSNEKKPCFPSNSSKKEQRDFDCNSNFQDNNNFRNYNIENNKEISEECFEIFGLKLHFDDLLIIALLFFLYQEDVKDTYLYIALILLLLS